MNYQKLLQHPKWQRRRLQIMERDEWKCATCGETEKKLNVHHRWYVKGRKPWEYSDNALITLCDDCHDCWHQFLDKYRDDSFIKKIEFINKILSSSKVPVEKIVFNEFVICTDPQNVNGSCVIYVPKGLFRSFCLPVQEIYKRMASEPDMPEKIKNCILDT